eukprot:gene40922-54185_t
MNLRTLLAVCTSACLLSAALSSQAASATRHLLFNGEDQLAGEQGTETQADGWTTVRYVFKDNGRGPELTERLKLAADGTLAEYQVQGSAMMGGPVDERFTRRGDQAEWTSAAESGRTSVSGTAFYVPREGSMQPFSAMLGALARQPDGKLPLLPNGKVARAALPALPALPAESTARARYVAPRNETEQVLAGLWGELLDIGQVGVEDNFFEIGGHSLLALQMFARIE